MLQEQDRTVTGPRPQSQRLTHRFVVDRLELEHRLGAVGKPDRDDPSDRAVRRRAVRCQRASCEQRVRNYGSSVEPDTCLPTPELLVPHTKLARHIR